MTAGNQPSVGGVNSAVAAFALNLRNTFQQITDFNNWISAYGGASALVTLGFSSGDAATIVSAMGNLATLANVANGTATQATAFNYIANTEGLWGGQ
jgi:hypothetical protein